MMSEVRPPPVPDLPQLPRSPSLHAVLNTPADRTGACRFLPHPRGLPRLTGGSASTTSLSRPAQASLALRPARLLARPKADFCPEDSTRPVTRPSRSVATMLNVDKSTCRAAELCIDGRARHTELLDHL